MGFKFKADEVTDSILMYTGQGESGRGDFASVTIKDGHLEFRFDTGSGPAILRSIDAIKPNVWYNVILERKLREGRLIFSEENQRFPQIVNGTSPGTTRGLNVRTPMYFGGIDGRDCMKI